jgi:hypothetical protein
MEESGEQGTVVFALIVTEPASESVCMWPHLNPSSRFYNNLCKDDTALFSRFLHAPLPCCLGAATEYTQRGGNDRFLAYIPS